MSPALDAVVKRQTISACLIVKNEEKRLARCLRSLVGVVDEIIVVDTGSTDASIEIARSFGAKVSNFPWVDDFSAARNRALEHASSDWVLSIDADEWLAAGATEPIREALARESAVAYRVTLVNHLDGDRREPESLTRLFRRRADIRFRGPIHEQVTESVAAIVAGAGCEWLDLSGVSLDHDGYLASIAEERGKRQRNLRLLKRAVTASPDDDYLRYKLAIELGADGAMHLAHVLRRLGAQPSDWLRARPWTQAALINGALAGGDAGLVEQAALACEAAFGETPTLHFARARSCAARGDAVGALAAITSAQGADSHGPAFDRGALSFELDLLAAAAHSLLEDYDVALSLLAKLREAHPDSPRPVYALIELALALGDVNSALALGLARLREAPGDSVALCLCARVAEQTGDIAVASRWRAAATQAQ